MKTRRKVWLLLFLTLVSLFGFTRNVSAESNLSPAFDRLFLLVSILSALVLLGVIALWIYFINKYREENEVERQSLSHEQSRKFEMGWTLLATFIVILLIIFSFPVIFNDTNTSEVDGDGEKIVVVGTGNWQWIYFYENGTQISEPERRDNSWYTDITLIKDTTYTFEFNNTGTFIHSYYVAELNIKMDVMPGELNYLTFTPTEVGEYDVQCTEFCGPGHSGMRGILSVVEA